ncbi:DUF3324 domain-containing protein [Lactobacillus sp. S2-2]|uniref:DUF3324 domain-containing protein n=1 Tax=Lactobacillus sp. S2-2 TaxID=2692917 RepID=UPI001F33D14F|nr:DUF3324 domain-containing protein [Lactobacillus sp. S2-2]MCF6515599.1 DUF3324 domain-containing protein [Lactobacillus sp. S2-2]
MKKSRISTLSIVLSLIITCLLFVSVNTKAQVVKGLALKPIYPSNQIIENGYLNPLVKPGTTQKLSFNIINFSNKTQKVRISANTAKTVGTPAIDYSDHKFLNDNKKQNNFNQLFDKSVIIKNVSPNKPTKITFNAKIPKQGFKGLLLGGFYIDNNLSLKTQQGSTLINNKYTYVMPVGIKEVDKIVKPKLTLGEVNGKNIFTRPQVNATIYNKKPGLINNMDVNTKVTNEDKKQVVNQRVQMTSVAPSTHFTMQNLANTDTLKPGKYHIRIVANSDQGKWVLEKDFTISNTQYMGSYLQANSWLIYLIIILILLLLLLIAYLIYRKYKKNQEKKELNS